MATANSEKVEVEVIAKHGLGNGVKKGDKCFLPETTVKILEKKEKVKRVKEEKGA